MRAWMKVVLAGAAAVLAPGAVLAQQSPVTAPPAPGAAPPAPQQRNAPQSGTCDPKAREVLDRMCRTLEGTKQFAVEGDSSMEVVLQNGQRLQFNASSDVGVSRPNKLRSQRIGPASDVGLIYDGSNFYVYDRAKNVYASSEAPKNNIDAAIDDARDRLDLIAPGADLLYSNACQGLLQDMNSLMYVGTEVVDGRRVDHLAARGNDTDWQLWIDAGQTPLPRKYVITTKDQPQSPQFEVNLRNWNLSPNFPPDYFTFRPAQGAARIAFMPPPRPNTAVGGTGNASQGRTP